MTDSEILRQAASYDSKALEMLYNRYTPLLYTVIKKIVVDEDIAGDILADVFVIIWKKARLFDFNTNNVYTWLITLARNKAVDVVRRGKNPSGYPAYDDEYEENFIIPRLSPAIDPLDYKTALNIKGNVETALNNLTDAQQYVIYLAYYEGLTEQEISTKLNIPLTTVKSKIKIALGNLRDNLIREETNG